MRNALLLVVTLLGASLCSGADVYPSKPVRIIVPVAAGGNSDLVARTISPQLTEQFGRSFVVENRIGASGIIGYGYVARSAPDGYTLLLMDTSFTAIPSLKKSLPYDPIKDFTPISQTNRSPQVLVVTPALKVNTLKEFIALAQANPGKLNYGSIGVGSSTALWSELFKIAAKVDIAHIPYKGGAETTTALLGNQVQMQVTGIPTVLAHINSGRMRALAVTTDGKRSPSLPDVPSMMEAGLSGMVVYGWHGLAGPAGLPREIVNKLHAEVVKAVAVASMKERFNDQGSELVGSSPEEFTSVVRNEMQRFAEIIKSAGIVPEEN